MVNDTPWTAERTEKLKVLHSEGLSCSQIGDAIGVTRNAVIGKIHRLGLTPSPDQAPRQHRGPHTARKPRTSRTTVKASIAPPTGADHAVTLIELGPHDCRALLDARNDHGEKLYCGQTHGLDWNGNRSSYCPQHHARFCITPKKHAA